MSNESMPPDECEPAEVNPETENSSKKNWSIPSAVIQNSDLQALLQSDEVQSVLNAPKASTTIKRSTKKNPLNNIRAMLKLNPNAATEKRAAWRVEEAAKKAK